MAGLADEHALRGEPVAAPHGRRLAPVLLLAFAVVLLAVQVQSLPAEPHSEAFHDELHYAQTARDVAAGRFPRFNTIFAPLVPPLYGTVQAPTRYFAGREGWDWWSRALNALLLVTSLVPLYRLGRRLLGPWWAALAAAVSVVSSSLVYARYLLAESLYIPLFLWLALAVTRACERPTRARGLQVGLLLGLCYLTRPIAVASAPALFVALCWSLRSPRQVAQAALALAAGTLLVVLPWSLRGLVFASEANLEPAFTYSQSLSGAGLQPLGIYLEWTWKTTGSFVIGLGLPALLLGLTGLLAGLTSRDPARRGLAAFTLTSALGTLVLVGFATAQWSSGILKLHERYLVCFWPLFVLAFCAELRAARVRPAALAAAGAVVLAVLFGMPAEYFDPSSTIVNPIDTPSAPIALWLTAWAGSGLAVRFLYLAMAAPALLLVQKPRWAAPALLLIGAGYLGSAGWIALEEATNRNRASEHLYRPVWDWLDGILRPGDLLIHHHLPGNTAYHNAMRYEMDYCQVDDDLVPLHSSSVRLDQRSGRYVYFDDSPPDPFFLLTEAPGTIDVPGTRTHGDLRLIPLQDGLPALGAWLSESDATRTVAGRAADGWCGRSVAIELASAYPSQAELCASVTLPEGYPSATPVSVSLRREGQILRQETLVPGGTWAFLLAETMWSPRLTVTVEADSDALVGGRRVAFQMSEPVMSFAPWSAPEDGPPPGPVLTGVRPDLWCGRVLHARFPLAPEGARYRVVLSHPSDSPLRGPLTVTLRIGAHAVAEIELEQGASHELVLSANSDRTELDFTLEADRDALLDGERVSYRLDLGAR